MKFELIETSPELMKKNEEHTLAKGMVDKLGEAYSRHVYNADGKTPFMENVPAETHEQAIRWFLNILVDPLYGMISSIDEIQAVGHRMVHGGEEFSGSIIINEDVMDGLRRCSKLAPLHNPHNIKGYEITSKLLPDIPEVAVFDTAFHFHMPEYAYLYALPYELYTKHQLRRYGFHGTSHRYISFRASQLLDKPYKDLKIVTAHLGNGCSMAAVKNGESVDTSMGFTPLEGLVMGTRCGDIDPAIVTFLLDEYRTPREVNLIMNKESGLYGISGISNDMRDIDREYEKKNKRAILAIDIFCYRIKKYVGAYAAAMGGIDVLVFAGGIGENSPLVRERSCAGLEFMGIKLSPERNEGRGEKLISADDSKVAVFSIQTKEELVIARDTVDCILKQEMAEKTGSGKK